MKTINNNIKEDYCSFELSRLLKEKGFCVKPENIDSTDYVLGYDYDEDDENDSLKIREFQFEDNVKSHLFLRPTHSLAIEWVRINFGIFIYVATHYENRLLVGYDWILEQDEQYIDFENTSSDKIMQYISPQEAKEHALIYVLKNLI